MKVAHLQLEELSSMELLVIEGGKKNPIIDHISRFFKGFMDGLLN
ncbi:Uncharacterised protein [Candidatus Ornithobacterium hominis]|uniref:Uncharacterized protein n=1 Tax=Candidatus Ornithobacterium hominis TaxID=2497989 RepID=A0A383U2Z3_9FLAO|nr:hypothetical protein [Candidatus Ornithobacterium hominis]MCT7904743.1 hypothetical protein [Candidatus Ornithobacterium hominis]CAI9429867.1 Bacteriocin [Candidatus Ornithobacterium hominis]SZD73910.1 Uncharacterised protein [Candidatus Ornithobacterium hominis]